MLPPYELKPTPKAGRNLPAAIGVAIASVLAAPYGTRLAHRIGGKALKQVFAAFMVMMGIAILASG